MVRARPPERPGTSPCAQGEATFAAPGVFVDVNAQSDAASFVSCLSGSRESEPSVAFESATVAASAVPSTT